MNVFRDDFENTLPFLIFPPIPIVQFRLGTSVLLFLHTHNISIQYTKQQQEVSTYFPLSHPPSARVVLFRILRTAALLFACIRFLFFLNAFSSAKKSSEKQRSKEEGGEKKTNRGKLCGAALVAAHCLPQEITRNELRPNLVYK